VPKVRITVNYPNGGSFTANYVNTGNNIVIALPTNLDGDYVVVGQSVCDESSGFYSPFSSQVVVTKTTANVTITNTAGGITISDITGIDGFVLTQLVSPGNTVTGNHNAFFATITFTYTGTPSIPSNAQLLLNNTIIQCIDIPVMGAGTYTFSASNFAATDQLSIIFSGGSCV